MELCSEMLQNSPYFWKVKPNSPIFVTFCLEKLNRVK